jgi:hypothetical protein
MSLRDAIHLAIAIIAEFPVFHTRDKKKKGGNVPLIGLPEQSPNGKIAESTNYQSSVPKTRRPT